MSSHNGSYYSKQEYMAQNHIAKTTMVIGQRYHIKNICLYSGITSKIYVAWDSIDKEVYAVKTIFKGSKEKGAQKQASVVPFIKDEIEIMKLLSQNDFVHLHNMRQTEDLIYIFLEYCNQGSLADLCRRQGYLEFEQAMPIFQKIIKGCKYMHKHNILHRRLRPEKILLSCSEPKISGFNSAVDMSNDNVPPPFTQFLDEYSAPEVHAEYLITLKSDVWSLGILFYKVLCGEHPWAHSDGKNWLDKMRKPFEFPQDIYIPLFFKKTLKSMLEFYPEKRPCMDLVFDYLNY